MRFEVMRTGDGQAIPTPGAVRDGDKWFIEIETLDDLIMLADNENEPLIVERGKIEIYDTWRES